MVLSELTLQQFRSYKKNAFRFSPDITLIVGPNTAGKTNILEAIQCLAVGKSFRAEKESDMVRWGEEVARIAGQMSNINQKVHDKNEKRKLELIITTGEVNGERAPTKKYLVNGVSRRQIDFIGNVRAVLFSPSDLELVTDSPSLRRQYLNSILVQTDREYRRNLFSYERGLRQRNKLLDLVKEGKAERQQLLFWNQLLIKSGSHLTEVRQAYIDFVNRYVLDNFEYHVSYDKSVISSVRLDQYKYEEVAAGATLVGPQRDDFMIMKRVASNINNKNNEGAWKDVSRFGSRGEQRLAVLWLKLAELSYVEEKTEDRPILLLDDIFSELDDEGREIVLSIIGKQQTVITTTDSAILREQKLSESAVIQL